MHVYEISLVVIWTYFVSAAQRERLSTFLLFINWRISYTKTAPPITSGGLFEEALTYKAITYSWFPPDLSSLFKFNEHPRTNMQVCSALHSFTHSFRIVPFPAHTRSLTARGETSEWLSVSVCCLSHLWWRYALLPVDYGSSSCCRHQQRQMSLPSCTPLFHWASCWVQGSTQNRPCAPWPTVWRKVFWMKCAQLSAEDSYAASHYAHSPFDTFTQLLMHLLNYWCHKWSLAARSISWPSTKTLPAS